MHALYRGSEMSNCSVANEVFRIKVMLDGNPTEIDIKADNFFDLIDKADRHPLANHIVLYANYLDGQAVYSISRDTTSVSVTDV